MSLFRVALPLPESPLPPLWLPLGRNPRPLPCDPLLPPLLLRLPLDSSRCVDESKGDVIVSEHLGTRLPHTLDPHSLFQANLFLGLLCLPELEGVLLCLLQSQVCTQAHQKLQTVHIVREMFVDTLVVL